MAACQKCGVELAADIRSNCPNCGTPIDASTQPSTPPAQRLTPYHVPRTIIPKGRLPKAIKVLSWAFIVLGCLGVVSNLWGMVVAQEITLRFHDEATATRLAQLSFLSAVALLAAGYFMRRLEQWAYWLALGVWSYSLLAPILFPAQLPPDMGGQRAATSGSIIALILPLAVLIVLGMNYQSYMKAAEAKLHDDS